MNDIETFHVAGLETAPDWRKVKDPTEDQDNDEDGPVDPAVKLVLGFDPDAAPDADDTAKNRSSEGLQTVRDILHQEGEEVVREFEAALQIEDPHERGTAILKVIGRIPGEIDKSDELTAAIETLLLDGFVDGAE